MKRFPHWAGAALAVTGLASTGAFAAPSWGPSGEANYEEHQAQRVSQYSRAEVQAAYLQAATVGTLPRTTEVVAESPAELAAVTMAQASPAQQPVAAVEQTEAPSYASPPDSVVVSSVPSAGYPLAMQEAPAAQAQLPAPDQPDAPLQANPDMITNNEDLALSEDEELVAGE